MKSRETQVVKALTELGLPAHIKGYYYSKEAILILLENPDRIHFITKELYPAIAKKYETTPSRVERAIRHGIEIVWNRGNMEMINDCFGHTIDNSKGKPTNSAFIATMSEKLRLEQME